MVNMTPKIKTGGKKVLLNEFMKESEEIYFYHKAEGRKIIPVNDKEKNDRAKQRLKEIFTRYKNNIPKRFIENVIFATNLHIVDEKGNDITDAVKLAAAKGSANSKMQQPT